MQHALGIGPAIQMEFHSAGVGKVCAVVSIICPAGVNVQFVYLGHEEGIVGGLRVCGVILALVGGVCYSIAMDDNVCCSMVFESVFFFWQTLRIIHLPDE